ncbi:MAG: hypothetical protein ACKVOR_13525 [Flavobacteriales bacterium]
MAANKQILLINFDFPPNQGIGGRRWGKLAKQLAHEGYHVHVIKADPVEHNNPSTWSDDVQHPNIHVHSLPRSYPQVVSHPTGKWIDKLRYRMAVKKLKRIERGTIYDISIGWNEVFAPSAAELIQKHNITNVIATGAPWNVLLYTVQLKEKFAALNIIVDYRDPWLNARNYGMQNLSPERKQAEVNKQKAVLMYADVVLTPYEYLTRELEDFAKEHKMGSAKFEVLTHFYDADDIKTTSTTNRSDKIVFVYGGDLYYELDKELELLREQLLQLRNVKPDLYAQVEFRIFSTQPDYKKFEGLDAVKMNGTIGKKIFEELQRADFSLVMLSHSKRNDRTTKFFEYLPLRKPMLVIADAGEVTNFVQQHQLGYVLNETENSLEKILEHRLAGNLNFDAQFDIAPYSLHQATAQLIGYLK